MFKLGNQNFILNNHIQVMQLKNFTKNTITKSNTYRCLGEVSGAGSCLEGVPGTAEGLEGDPIGVDVSTIGHVTSSEVMVDV